VVCFVSPLNLTRKRHCQISEVHFLPNLHLLVFVIFQLKSVLNSSVITVSQLSSDFVIDVASSFQHAGRGADSPVPVQSFINKEFTKTKNKLNEIDAYYMEVMFGRIWMSNFLNACFYMIIYDY